MADRASQPQRKRARQACLACNARRVKCDVTERQPCQNCVTANVRCETRESRRGKHPRPSKKQSVDSRASGARSQNDEEVEGAHVLASLHRNTGGDITKPETAVRDFIPDDALVSPRVDTRLDEDGNVFLGEATSLRYIHDDLNSRTTTASPPAHGVRLRYTVPSAARAEALIPDWEAERRLRRKAYLQQESVFMFPQLHVVEGLLKAYFRWFHPCFAIVDEMDVWEQHAQGTLSPILLQAMLFIGVLHCEESVLQALSEGPRHRAKYIFFTRAKEIYDAEVEQNKITVIQALFLMSFWRAGALLEKDVRHWLGAAITLAQTKALHRAGGTAINKATKLRKRIWWSLYARDRQCAAALGLPNRVRDEDCDFECMELSDFEHAFHPSIPPKDADQYARYAIGMAELAKFLGQIVHTGYLPNKTLDSPYREQMRTQLVDWKNNLPHAMQPDSDYGERPSFFANMLHLGYNNLLILLYRQSYLGTKEDNQEADGNIATHAAAKNTRIIEDMLSDNTLRHGQIHVITNLFNTLCMHTVTLRRSDGTTRTVAESRAKLCLHGLQELQKTWEVTNWVLQLFFQYLDRSTAARLRVQQQDDYLASQSVPKWSSESSPHLKAQQPAPADQILRTLASLPAFEPALAPTIAETQGEGVTPWSWTSEEANQFLFSRIENDFSFGEGEIPEYWNPEELEFNASLFPPNDANANNFLP